MYPKTDYRENRELVLQKATDKGKKVVFSNSYTLQIDIDDEKDFNRWKKSSDLLELLKPREVIVSESSGGFPHMHITVHLSESAHLWKRIALQVLLGSDYERERMNACRALLNIDNIAFFEKIGENEEQRNEKEHKIEPPMSFRRITL